MKGTENDERRMRQMALVLLVIILIIMASLLVGCRSAAGGWRGLKLGGGVELTTPFGNIGLATKRGGEFTCGPSEPAPLPAPPSD